MMEEDYKTLLDIIIFVNLKPVDKIKFIADNNERTVHMIDYLVNVTKDR
jgi:hypothetical protein